MPDYRTWTQREYGNRTGIFRVLDVLDRYQIRAGVAVNAMAAERYPYLIEQFKKRKYEFIAHGTLGQPHDHLEDERGRGEGRDRRSDRRRSRRRPA